MAQEVSETSVASSSPTPNCWEIHAPLSSWNYSHINRWQPHSHHSTSSSCDEDNSISNTTSLMDSSSADLSGDPPDNNLWSQVLLNVGGGVEMHHHQNHENGENFLEVLSSKSLPTEIFDPACDYLKKMDSSWEINNFNGGLMEHERFTNLSDLVKNWSLAPPANSQFDHVQIAPNSLACNIPINPMSTNSHIKHDLANNGVLSSNYLPYMHEIKMENQHQDHINGYQFGLNNTITGFDNKFHSPISTADVSWSSSSSRSLSDLISFKPVQFRTSKQVLKGSDHSSHDANKSSSSTRGSGRSTGTTNEGKKKRSEENNSEALLKKSKLENSSSSSSVKLQVPKVKFADRISALQQIVSPFGKTDTASVLMEAINYIRFLQEQVQLLSDPYMKLNANMEQNSWGGMERKEKDKVDLKTRGLCLVPISCTPQAYRENSGPDYWTPTYRGCLYR
ncbi:hypothetical protein J5N97_021759 [Dioscorea zingiberensis]|uniref:BHLH domain-containing protein n=1 Tax=Dioscorea zingiberensis TaxID=325984 RepID=A0A9D5HA64_9LILI|nr:hypothetical protein J5N97_021759 [Dioscorea zingiberensis]